MLPKAFSAALSVMDRLVTLRASDERLLAAAAAACGSWGPPDVGQGPPIALELEAAAATSDGPIGVAVDGRRLRLSGTGVQGWADAASLSAACRIPLGLLDQPGRFAGEVIDTLLLFLLTRSGRIPLHAAGLMLGEVAVLLAGPSGAGKSTLSLAAMARGLQILSDDTVYIQLQPRLRIWGLPRPVHVFPADAPGFTGQTRLRGGKLKTAVPVPAWSGPPAADRAVVVLLERGGRVSLEPASAAQAAEALSRLEPGFDLLGPESAQAIAAVTADGAWRMTLTDDPAAAIALLAERFGVPAASTAEA